MPDGWVARETNREFSHTDNVSFNPGVEQPEILFLSFSLSSILSLVYQL